MLKKLQHKFMIIAMFALGSLLIVQIFAINAVNIYQRDLSIRTTLEAIAENNGRFPDNFVSSEAFAEALGIPFFKDTPYSTRYFVVEINKNVVSRISTDSISGLSRLEAFNYASRIYPGEEGFGFIDTYRYLYVKNGTTSLMVFIDFQKEMNYAATLATVSAFVSVLTLILILIPVYWLSKWAIRPIAKNIEKQKQFITDASHELKTPLAIISADAEVMEMCEGENEWLTSIKNQTNRMNELVKNLVQLSKSDEINSRSARHRFNLSAAIADTASGFELPAKHAGKEFTVNIAPDIYYTGDEQEIRQLISILCDNAIKYSDEKGIIRLSVTKNTKSISIDMYNTCEYVNPETAPRLFDRFYRADASRSRETGGYGIGLSIAKAIVERHKGKIRAYTSGTTAITFKITL